MSDGEPIPMSGAENIKNIGANKPPEGGGVSGPPKPPEGSGGSSEHNVPMLPEKVGSTLPEEVGKAPKEDRLVYPENVRPGEAMLEALERMGGKDVLDRKSTLLELEHDTGLSQEAVRDVITEIKRESLVDRVKKMAEEAKVSVPVENIPATPTIEQIKQAIRETMEAQKAQETPEPREEEKAGKTKVRDKVTEAAKTVASEVADATKKRAVGAVVSFGEKVAAQIVTAVGAAFIATKAEDIEEEKQQAAAEKGIAGERETTRLDSGVITHTRALLGEGLSVDDIVGDFEVLGYSKEELNEIRNLAERINARTGKTQVPEGKPVTPQQEKEDTGKEVRDDFSNLSYVELRNRLISETDEKIREQVKAEKFKRYVEIDGNNYADLSQDFLEPRIREVLVVSDIDTVDRNLNQIADDMENTAKGIDAYSSNKKLKGGVYDMVRGEIDAVRLDMYLGLSNAELEARGMDRKKLEADRANLDKTRLGLATVRAPSGLLKEELSEEQLKDFYARQVPGAEEAYRRRVAEREARERAEKPPPPPSGRGEPEAENEDDEYKQVTRNLLGALTDGQWIGGRGANSAEDKVDRWIADHMGDPEVSWIKALKGLADWRDRIAITKADKDKLDVTLSLTDLDTEKLEALEQNKELLVAKRAVLEMTGFNFNAQVKGEDGKMRKITGADIRAGNFPEKEKFKTFLDKNKIMITRPNGNEVPFWKLGPNDAKAAGEVFRKQVAEALSVTKTDGTKYDPESEEVKLLTMVAIRQIQHTGLWSMFHTEYSSSAFIDTEMTRAMHPGDAYLYGIENNDKSMFLDGGGRPGHYRLVSGNMDLFRRRNYDDCQYPKVDFSNTASEAERKYPVPGFDGMDWNRLVFPPELLKSYVTDTQVFADFKTCLWDIWSGERNFTDRREFKHLGPFKIPGFKRTGAETMLNELWDKVTKDKIWAPGGPFLKEMGLDLVGQLKNWGVLIESKDKIEARLEEPEYKQMVQDLVRFKFMRNIILMTDQEHRGKLDMFSFDAKRLAIAMEGWKVEEKTAQLGHKNGIRLFAPERWDYDGKFTKEGWWVDVQSDEIPSQQIKIKLEDEKMIKWLRNGGVDFPKTGFDLHREVTKWLEDDRVAKVLIHQTSMGLEDHPIDGWDGFTVRQAFNHGWRRWMNDTQTGGTKEVLVGGLGSRGEVPLKKWLKWSQKLQETQAMRYLL